MGKYEKPKTDRGGGEPAPRPDQKTTDISDNPQLPEVAAWLRKVKFRKKLFGGLDAADVWKKLGELNALYEQAVMAERIRYDLLLAQQKQDSAEDILYGDLSQEDDLDV